MRCCQLQTLNLSEKSLKVLVNDERVAKELKGFCQCPLRLEMIRGGVKGVGGRLKSAKKGEESRAPPVLLSALNFQLSSIFNRSCWRGGGGS